MTLLSLTSAMLFLNGNQRMFPLSGTVFRRIYEASHSRFMYAPKLFCIKEKCRDLLVLLLSLSRG